MYVRSLKHLSSRSECHRTYTYISDIDLKHINGKSSLMPSVLSRS